MGHAGMDYDDYLKTPEGKYLMYLSGQVRHYKIEAENCNDANDLLRYVQKQMAFEEARKRYEELLPWRY